MTNLEQGKQWESKHGIAEATPCKHPNFWGVSGEWCTISLILPSRMYIQSMWMFAHPRKFDLF